MKLISDTIDETNILTESYTNPTTGKKEPRYIIEGIFLQGNIKNGNGRIYPIEVLDREVKDYTERLIVSGRAVGELGHPDSPAINLDRISHKIESLVKDGTNYIGKARITSKTPMGSIVCGLLEDGVRLGVSSRGAGSIVERGGISYVQDDFRLVTAADIVADPSAPDAFVNGIMEGKEWVFENGVWELKTLEEARETIEKTKARKLQEVKLQMFERFLRVI